MNNPLAVSTNTYHGFSLDEALKGIAKAGFKFVELTGVKGYTEHVSWEMDDRELSLVKEKLAHYGLTSIALSGHSNLTDPEGFATFQKNIELAGRLGCQFVITSVGEAHNDESEITPEDERTLVALLQVLTVKCNQAAVNLALETHGNNYPSGAAMSRLVQKVNSRLVGINYDTANVIFYGNVRPEDDITKAIEKLYYIHLKDKAGKNQEWNFPAIGKGYIDFPKLFRILKDNHYTGPISVEVEFNANGPSTLGEVDQAVKDSFDRIQSILKLL